MATAYHVGKRGAQEKPTIKAQYDAEGLCVYCGAERGFPHGSHSATNLLVYVIAYLQEEQTRWNIQEASSPPDLKGEKWTLTGGDIRFMLTEALEAYEAGAR